MKLKLIEIALFLALFISVTSCLSFDKECEGIREKVLRLHVIANSDTDTDQSLKLKVRDSILSESEEIFTDTDSLIAAENEIVKTLPKIEECAENTVIDEGFSYDVTVRFEPSYFPTRTYENVTLPAGFYKSLKVIIGEGEGKNWWCVLFPPMCLPAAMKEEEVLSAVLTEDELSLVSSEPKYEIRFWIVEKLQEFKRSYKRKT